MTEDYSGLTIPLDADRGAILVSRGMQVNTGGPSRSAGTVSTYGETPRSNHTLVRVMEHYRTGPETKRLEHRAFTAGWPEWPAQSMDAMPRTQRAISNP